MLNTKYILIYFFLCALQERLDGFPKSRLSHDLNSTMWFTEQPSAPSSNDLWTSPSTELYSSYGRDWISTTSLLLLQLTRNVRISSSNDRDLIRSYDNDRNKISSSDPLLSTLSDDQTMIPSLEQELYPSFENKGKCLHSSRSSLTTNKDMETSRLSDNYLRLTSLSSDKKLKVSTTPSYAMHHFSNFRLSKHQDAPMILFDSKGEMHTNYYPPVGFRNNKNNHKTEKTDNVDWSRRYWPKWLVVDK
ncbi:uncharacterized protein LOC114124117 isoform X1 [Aphis gossypii]|uniref:uncharacterized protein LOC114124117 isoform X1 n=1 Tax=Aphis gossypii TaxID=80765 RepID=UPI002158F538|nr:uncharacterized protein LOC114124117 isoform X1 [Aphis gossypii]